MHGTNDLQTLDELIRSLGQRGGRPAVVALGEAGPETWEYGRLAEHVDRVARRFQPGERVALLAGNEPAWIAVCLGVLRAGGVAVPLDVQLSDEVLTAILEDCRPGRVVTTADQQTRVEGLPSEEPAEIIHLEGDPNHWPAEDSGMVGADPAPAAEDTAVIFYTSGTTGPPKGVPLSHGNLVHQLNDRTIRALVRSDDRLLLPLPLHHVYPFAIGMLLPLANGIPIVLPAALTGPQIVRAVNEAQVTAIIGVPRLYRALYEGIQGRIADTGWPGRSLMAGLLSLSIALRRHLGWRWGRWLLRPIHRRLGPHLRILASGGAPLDPDLALRLEGLGWPLAIGYGLSETAPLLTYNPPHGGRLGSVGRAIRDVELRIARPPESEPSDAPTAPQGQGEIQVRGPNVFAGYLNRPEQTEAALTPDGWFKTGDLGWLDREGFVYVTGRVSTRIVTEGGENIQPDEVEAAYEVHPAIREIGVFQSGRGLVAVVVPDLQEIHRGSRGNVHQAIQDALAERAQRLPTYQRLAEVVISRDALARTRLGKIQRHKLAPHFDRTRAQEAGAATGPARPVAITEMSDADQALLEVPAARRAWEWLAARYPDNHLTPDSSPQLDLGIDSLEWLNISLELRQRTGIELTESMISGVESVRDLLQAFAEPNPEGKGGVLSAPLDDPESRLTAEQLAWLQPRSRGQMVLARVLYLANEGAMRLYFRRQVRGRENLPDAGQYVITPNHVSYLDPMAVATALGWTRLQEMHWAGFSGIMLANPFMRLISRLARVVPINPDRAAVSSLLLGAAVLRRGRSLVWFPEGIRSRSGELLRFQTGLGMLVEHFDVPVVPVWLQGTHRAMPPGRFWPRPHRLEVRIGAPLTPEQLRQQGTHPDSHQRITQAVRAQVEALGDID